MHIGHNEIVCCNSIGATEKPGDRLAIRTYTGPALAGMLFVGAASGASFLPWHYSHEVALLATLAVSLAANVYFALRVKRIGMLLSYAEFQANRETDLRGLIGFIGSCARE